MQRVITIFNKYLKTFIFLLILFLHSIIAYSLDNDINSDSTNDVLKTDSVTDSEANKKVIKTQKESKKQKWFDKYQEPWYGGFFFSLFMQWDIIPIPLTDYVFGIPGALGSLGYERLGFIGEIRSGYIYIKGSHDLIINSMEIPLTFHFAYDFKILKWLSIEPSIGVGAIFSVVTHYNTEIDRLLENKIVSNDAAFFMQTEGRINFAILNRGLIFFTGFGIDYLQEKKGPIVLPTISAGLKVYPGRFIKKREKPIPTTTTTTTTIPTTTVTTIPTTTTTTTTINIDDDVVVLKKKRAREDNEKIIERINFAVYFGPNSAVLTKESNNTLDKIAKIMIDNPDSDIIISGYAASFYSKEAQFAISEKRAYGCFNYIKDNYKIDPDRVEINYFGSEKKAERIVNIEVVKYSK